MKKKFIRIASVIALLGFLALQQGIIASADNPIIITFPANRGTWATGALPVSPTGARWGQRVTVDLPAHDVQSRIILGTNAFPGAATGWLDHAAGRSILVFHRSSAPLGTNVRAQFRTATSRSNAFTSGGSWSP